MMPKITIALVAALLLGFATATQAGDSDNTRQTDGFSSSVGALGQPRISGLCLRAPRRLRLCAGVPDLRLPAPASPHDVALILVSRAERVRARRMVEGQQIQAKLNLLFSIQLGNTNSRIARRPRMTAGSALLF